MFETMRLRVAIQTTASEIPWDSVQAPGRSIAYHCLARHAPELGRVLHEKGWGPHGMAPFGYGAPVFPKAVRRRGVYAAGGIGFTEFGSPLPGVIEAFAAGIRERELLDWGGVALRVAGCEVVDPPSFTAGSATFRTVTPVVLKGSGRDEDGGGESRQTWVLPTEPEFGACLRNNLRRKAETLGLVPDLELQEITWVGPKRAFVVSGGKKPGAAVEVRVSGSPEVLAAVWSWGLGQANSAGFGWVGA